MLSFQANGQQSKNKRIWPDFQSVNTSFFKENQKYVETFYLFLNIRTPTTDCMCMVEGEGGGDFILKWLHEYKVFQLPRILHRGKHLENVKLD